MNDKKISKENTDSAKRFQKIKRIISSVVIAIVVWFLIVNVVNPRINVSLKDVPVNFVGEGYLRERGFVVVDKDKIPDFSIKVKGTRSDLLAGMDRIRVEIDLSAVDKEGKFTVTPTVRIPDYLSLEKQGFFGIELSIEHSYEKTIPLKVEQIIESRRKNKDVIIKSEPEFDEIKVTGSRKDVDAVKGAVAVVNLEDVTENGKTVYTLNLVDESGNPLPDDTSIFCSNSTVPVTNTVYAKKTVGVKIEADDSLKTKYFFGYENDDISIKNIDIGVLGDEKVPEHVVLVIPEKEYEDGETEIKLKIKEQDGIYVPDYEIVLNAKVEKLKEVGIMVTPQLKNIPGGLTGSVEPTYVKVYATEHIPPEIKAEVDCTGFVAGQNQGKIKFTDKRVVSEGDIAVSVTLR